MSVFALCVYVTLCVGCVVCAEHRRDSPHEELHRDTRSHERPSLRPYCSLFPFLCRSQKDGHVASVLCCAVLLLWVLLVICVVNGSGHGTGIIALMLSQLFSLLSMLPLLSVPSSHSPPPLPTHARTHPLKTNPSGMGSLLSKPPFAAAPRAARLSRGTTRAARSRLGGSPGERPPATCPPAAAWSLCRVWSGAGGGARRWRLAGSLLAAGFPSRRRRR